MKISQQIKVLMTKINSLLIADKNNIKNIENINNQANHIIEQIVSLEIYVEKLKIKEKKNVLD